MTSSAAPPPTTRRLIRRWQHYLADERAEAALYEQLAERRSGEERDILLELAEAEGRHAAHWRELLESHAPGRDRRARGSIHSRMLVFLARHFGSVFVLALAQRAEGRSPYATDEHATSAMAADERIHGEVVRGLATRGRRRLSGTLRAAVFGANDGLVSNLALVLGIGAAGSSARVVLFTGIAGLLAGAISMGAGEYVSVRSQRELLEASTPDPQAAHVLPHLDVDANELALVYRARGESAEDAARHADDVLAGFAPWSHDPMEAAEGGPGQPSETAPAVPGGGDGADADRSDPANPGGGDAADADGGDGGGAACGHPQGDVDGADHTPSESYETIGTAWRAAISSFCFFASGAVIPIVPYIAGIGGISAQAIGAGLVGIALLLTGAVVGLLSGGPPIRRALRQLGIGYGAAVITYALGLLFNA